MNTKDKQTQQNRTRIRSIGLGRINHLVRAAAHLETLAMAFQEWANGDIYVCKKTGSYRYRFGEKSKGETSWSRTATGLFTTPEEFAFAALVFAQKRPQAKPAQPDAPTTPPRRSTRVNVISIAA